MFSPYAAMGNNPGMVDPNGETTKYAEDLTAAENDWLMNSPGRLAWNLGRNTDRNGAGRMLGHNMGGDMMMLMYAGGGGSFRIDRDGSMSGTGAGARIMFELYLKYSNDLSQRYVPSNDDLTDLELGDDILPGLQVSARSGKWLPANLDEVVDAIQRRMLGGNNSLGLLGLTQSGSLFQAGLFGDVLGFAEKHFNGSIGLVGYAAEAYNKIPNDIKRKYAYKLSKVTGWKSGKIFQEVKAFSKNTTKITGKLGPYGTILTVGVIGYEVATDTWDAHTIVNGALLIGGVAATIFSAPAVLTGIALYGIADYFFDFGGKIDSAVGRNSRIW